MSSDHSLIDIFKLTVSTPLLVIIIVMLPIILLRRCASDKMRDWGFVISTAVLNVDENLPQFFDAVKLSDKEWFINESRYL